MTPLDMALLAGAVALTAFGLFVLAVPRLAWWYFQRRDAA